MVDLLPAHGSPVTMRTGLQPECINATAVEPWSNFARHRNGRQSVFFGQRHQEGLDHLFWIHGQTNSI